MRHTLYFNFVFDRGQSKEDYLNRILSFLKGYDAETIFNKIYHSELKDEVFLMDKVPQNSIKYEINLNDENDFNKSVLKVVQYMEHYVNHVSGNLPFVITFKKSFQRISI